jgi:saccharopine dehydrogenase-like NADP-dependent oxidoreductase
MLVNAAGPDFEMQVPALKAAIAAGVNYADVAGDGRATDKALAWQRRPGRGCHGAARGRCR